MNKEKMTKSSSPKEIYVRVLKLAPSEPNAEFDLLKLKEEYDNEGKTIRSWNVFSGGGIGASIGVIACLVTTAIGAPVTSPEIFAIVGVSLLFGIIAGFVLY